MMYRTLFYSLLTGLFSLAVIFSAHAEQQASPQEINALMKELQAQSKRMEDSEKKLAAQEKALEDQKRSLIQQRILFEKLSTHVIAVTGKPLPVAAGTATPGKMEEPQRASYASGPQEVGTERKEAKDQPPEVPAIIDEGGVLTKPGKFVLTPAIEYSHASATSVAISGFSIIPAINIGLFDISKVNRDIVTSSIDLRYGVTPRFEVEAKVPYVYRKDSTLERPAGVLTTDTLRSVDGYGIGDVEVAGHYQINKGQGGWPFLVGNLRLKSATGTSPFEVPVVGGLEQKLPTGSGFYSFQPSITAIFPTDPLVYYGNVGYLHSLSRSFTGYGTIQPGDAFSANLGMSLALNEKSSFSIGYDHTMVLKTMANNAPIANSDVLQVGALDLGFSYMLNDRTNLNFTVSAGLTEDAPDVRLIFRTPITFGLR